MDQIRLTTWDGSNPINNGIIIILGGAGFCPSTVVIGLSLKITLFTQLESSTMLVDFTCQSVTIYHLHTSYPVAMVFEEKKRDFPTFIT